MPVKELEHPMTKHRAEDSSVYSLSDFISVPTEFVSHVQPKLEIGAVINNALKEQGTSIRKFSDAIDMKHPQVIKILKGNKNYTIDTLLTILNNLDLEISIKKRNS